MSYENSYQIHEFAFEAFSKSDEKADFASRLQEDSERNQSR